MLNGPYRSGQYSTGWDPPRPEVEGPVRLWDGAGRVVADFPATDQGIADAKHIAFALNKVVELCTYVDSAPFPPCRELGISA